MKKRIVSISPWQSAKNMAILYFAFGVLIVIPIGVLSHFAPGVPGQTKPGIGFFVLMPFLYGLAGLIFVPLGCWMYNKVAGFMGGIEFEVSDSSQQEGGQL